MEDDIKRILKLLEDGKITADESIELIKAIKGNEESQGTKRHHYKFKYDFVAPILDDVFSGLKTTFNSFGEYVGPNGEKKIHKVESEYDGSNVKSISIKIFGGDIDIEESKGNSIKFENSDALRGKAKIVDEDMSCKFFGSTVKMEIPKTIATLTISQMGGDLTAVSSMESLTISSKGGDSNLTLKNIKDLCVKQSGGDLTCYLPEDINATLEVNCLGGDFSSEISYEGRKKRGRVTGKFREGAKGSIQISSLGGDVIIKKLK